MVANTVQKAKKTKKQRKHGRAHRGRDYAKVYKLSNRREHNKIKRLKKHLIRHVTDKVAQSSLDHCKIIVGIRG